MSLILMMPALAQSGKSAGGTKDDKAPVTLKDVIDGKVIRPQPAILTEGYRGIFARNYRQGEKPTDWSGIEPVYEFSGGLSRSSQGQEKSPDPDSSPNRPAIYVVLDKYEWNSPTPYVKDLPSFETFKRLPKVSDYRRILGPPLGDNCMVVVGGIQKLSLCWHVFTLEKNKSIRVMGITLQMSDYGKGKGWEIRKRSLEEGIFTPTGKPPEGVEMLEKTVKTVK